MQCTRSGRWGSSGPQSRCRLPRTRCRTRRRWRWRPARPGSPTRSPACLGQEKGAGREGARRLAGRGREGHSAGHPQAAATLPSMRTRVAVGALPDRARLAGRACGVAGTAMGLAGGQLNAGGTAAQVVASRASAHARLAGLAACARGAAVAAVVGVGLQVNARVCGAAPGLAAGAGTLPGGGVATREALVQCPTARHRATSGVCSKARPGRAAGILGSTERACGGSVRGGSSHKRSGHCTVRPPATREHTVSAAVRQHSGCTSTGYLTS